MINVKFNLQGHVPRGHIIGHFGPLPLNKQFFSTSKIHISIIQTPNGVKFQIKLNIIERATTLYKEPSSFEAHIKSYSMWKEGSFDL